MPILGLTISQELAINILTICLKSHPKVVHSVVTVDGWVVTLAVDTAL